MNARLFYHINYSIVTLSPSSYQLIIKLLECRSLNRYPVIVSVVGMLVLQAQSRQAIAKLLGRDAS